MSFLPLPHVLPMWLRYDSAVTPLFLYSFIWAALGSHWSNTGATLELHRRKIGDKYKTRQLVTLLVKPVIVSGSYDITNQSNSSPTRHKVVTQHLRYTFIYEYVESVTNVWRLSDELKRGNPQLFACLWVASIIRCDELTSQYVSGGSWRTSKQG